MANNDYGKINGITFDEAMSMLQCGFIKTTVGKDMKIVYFNDFFCNMLGYTREEIVNVFHNDVKELVVPEEIERCAKLIKNVSKENTKINTTIWLKGKDGPRCLLANGKYAEEADGNYFYYTYTDITVHQKQENELILAKEKMDAIISHSDMFFWEYDIKTQCAYMAGRKSGEHATDAIVENYPECVIAMGMLTEESIVFFRELHKKISDGAPVAECDIKYTEKFGGNWYRVKYTNTFDDNGHPIRAYATAEIINSFKELEERFSIACENEGMRTWDYYIKEKMLIDSSNNNEYFGGSEALYNQPLSTIKKGIVHRDDIEKFKNLYKYISAGASFSSARIRLRKDKNSPYDWFRISYTTIFDKDGKPYKAVGCSRNINTEIENETRYLAFQNYQKLAAKSSIASCRMNLSTNWCGDSISELPELFAIGNQATVDKYFDVTGTHIDNDEDVESYNKVFNRDSLLKKFKKGENSPTFTYRHAFANGTAKWLRIGLNMTENPNTGDIEAIMYATDVTDEIQRKAVIDRLLSADYTYIGGIDVKTKTVKTFGVRHNPIPIMPAEDGTSDYFKCMQDNFKILVPEDRYDEMIERVRFERVISEIDKNEYYFNLYPVKYKGGIHYINIKFGYLTEAKTTVMFTMVDMSDTYYKEAKHREELEKALAAAKQASVAKSDFLARMSHDMRTPMNGVLGLIELTLDMDMSKEVYNNLKKMQMSGKYLLNLINDTLDMNKIESDKLKISLEPVLARDYWGAFLASIKPSAEEKGVKLFYSVPKFPPENEYVLADRVRIQQVLTNVINNAIKFTPNGGFVRVDFKSESDGKVHHDEVVVTDTGCGISEEFLPKVFVPFEQENNDVNKNVVGTGLGMSIVKNLINIMGGSIDIKSTKGKGTVVTIKHDFDVCDKPTESQSEIFERSNDLSRLNYARILLCEDHPLNAEIAKRLLESKGCVVDVAADGSIGLNTFINSPVGFYNVILMDIRMPVMDGLEATVAIRALDRKDAKTVPIIAMTANAFDEDREKSKAAGMNEHLAKPVEPKKLFSTIASYLKDID